MQARVDAVYLRGHWYCGRSAGPHRTLPKGNSIPLVAVPCTVFAPFYHQTLVLTAHPLPGDRRELYSTTSHYLGLTTGWRSALGL